MRVFLAAPAACFVFAAAPALAQSHDHGAHQHQPAQPEAHSAHRPPPAQADPHAGHGMAHERGDAAHAAMGGLYGPYQAGRDASGTSWQPDVASHGGLHHQAGDWTVMSHLMLNGVYAWSDGPRGDEKAFLAGMAMASARRDIGADSVLNLRLMLSPDPFMGANGYPLLLAAGETADGINPLVDRQHPHDLFMELAGSYTHRLSASDAVFVYAGLPGEPAFGPPAFMHRMAAMDSPEAPITHHWFDSTHITFGVLTAGYVRGDWKIEASQFRGREPDEDRYDIESGALDSTAVRLSWNPTPNWALQASWADIESPEALHPDEDEERWSVSAQYAQRLGAGGAWWAATLAFSNKERSDGVSLDAWLAEAALHPNDSWTFFARGEAIETDELGAHHGPVEDVARVSLGAIHDWRINENAVFGVGALAQAHFVSNALEPSYDGDPAGAMGFVRLKIG
jgi:hypothetical protein